jgi:hypothetical protein
MPRMKLLQKFYRGLELPTFIESLNDQLRRQLRIIPDKSGPLIFLRSFGSIPLFLRQHSLLAGVWISSHCASVAHLFRVDVFSRSPGA